jgi:hypothetical protein
MLMAFLAIVGLAVPAVGQCDPQIKHSWKQKTSSEFSISLASTEVSAARVELYDLMLGKIIQTKEVQFTSAETEVFTKVPPSTYTIHVWIEGCTKSKGLGGIKGIEISKSSKNNSHDK